jgi:PAS domain-containing protein
MGLLDKTKWIAGPAWSIALRYGLALASVAAALGFSLAFLHFHLPQPFGAFAVSAIAITFWYAGAGPGIFAAVLSSLIRLYFFDPGISTGSRVAYDLVFLVFALLMTQLVRGREELEQRVEERTAELTRLNDNLKSEIAEHNRIEAELRLSQAYLAEAQRLSHTGSWAWSPPPGDIRYWSEECYRVQGFDPKEGHPRFESLIQRMHPDDQARVLEVIERAVRKKEDFKFDYRIVHPSPSGDLVEYVGTIIDVTERKQAEDKIRQS